MVGGVLGFVGEEEVELDLVEVDGLGGDEFVEVLPLVEEGFVVGEVGADGFVEEGFESFDEFFLIIPLNHIK